MSVKEILLLGNPVLRTRCTRVANVGSNEVRSLIADLRDTLADFRARRGFGRGIAAPQIGASLRVIYLVYEYEGALINPRIVRRSRNTFRLWDDCFSFPDLLAYVRRSLSIDVTFTDEQGKRRRLKATGALSELLQHEIDHLDGILAIDRAIDSKHIILRSEYHKLVRTATVVM
jgi:peptide deformylase